MQRRYQRTWIWSLLIKSQYLTLFTFYISISLSHQIPIPIPIWSGVYQGTSGPREMSKIALRVLLLMTNALRPAPFVPRNCPCDYESYLPGQSCCVYFQKIGGASGEARVIKPRSVSLACLFWQVYHKQEANTLKRGREGFSFSAGFAKAWSEWQTTNQPWNLTPDNTHMDGWTDTLFAKMRVFVANFQFSSPFFLPPSFERNVQPSSFSFAAIHLAT